MVQFQRNTPDHKKYRRNLRTQATKSERILWQQLKNKQLGVKFRRQVSIGTYIIDFYCHEKKLVIELDGYTHQGDEAIAKDNQKQDYLVQNGYTVCRYSDAQVIDYLEKVLQQIRQHV